jgi:hypothetical protein
MREDTMTEQKQGVKRENDRDDPEKDDDKIPERPPTEPESPPVKEPPREPGKPGSYIVHDSRRTEPRSGERSGPSDRDAASEQRPPAEPPTASEEAAEGFITEVESLTPGVGPSEPGTFRKDPE